MQLTFKVKGMLDQRFSEVWVVGEIDEDIVKALKEIVRDEKLRGVKRLKFIFYLSDPKNFNYLNLLRSALLENTSMSIVVEEKSLENLLDDVKLIDEEVKVIRGKVIPAEFMKVMEMSSNRLKIVR